MSAKVAFSNTSDEDELSEACGKSASLADSDERPSPPPTNVPVKKGAVKELSPCEIRWFHKSASSEWIPFKGRDSLLIEVKQRLYSNEAISDEFADKETILNLCKRPIVVLDGYYELCIAEKKITPIYWKGPSIEIIQGKWFIDYDWSPLDADLADEIEEQHLKMFRGQKVPETPVYSDKGQKPVLHTMKSKGCKIEWNSIIDVSLQPVNRTWMMSLRLKSTATKLRRCYHTEASLEDGPCPINHLLFVVHGIGQKRQVNQIIVNTNLMRSKAEDLLKHSYSDYKFRPFFIPVEWRTSLNLDEDIFEAITPPQVQFFRSLLNSTAMDILYYASPKYRSEVAAGIVSIFNRLYALFLYHNAYFESIGGSVSIVAHSLGSVLCYDVITNYSPLVQYEEFVSQRLASLLESNLFGPDSKIRLQNLEKCRKDLELNEGGLLTLMHLADAKKMVINFKVSNLFCLGSPLSVFLALRGQLGFRIFENFSPKIYNIFNTSDPVAYRLEPLMHTAYAEVNPLRIHKHDSKSFTPYEEMPLELRKSLAATSSKKDSPGAEKSKKKKSGEEQKLEIQGAQSPIGNVEPLKAVDPTSGDEKADKPETPRRSWSAAVFSRFRQSSGGVTSNGLPKEKIEGQPSKNTDQTTINADAASPSTPEAPVCGPVVDLDFLAGIPEENKLPYRLDYALKEGKFEILPIVIAAHTNYWQKTDVVMFILTQLYGLPNSKKS